MKLSALHPTFLIRNSDREFTMTHDLAQADGIKFLCPVCFQNNDGPVGTHAIVCWKPTVPQTTSPTPGRWEMLGSGYSDLTLRAGSSSVLLQTSPCEAHFFVENGEITKLTGKFKRSKP